MIYLPVKTNNDFFENLSKSGVNILFDDEYITELKNNHLTVNDVHFEFDGDKWDFSSIKKKNTTGVSYNFEYLNFCDNAEYIMLLKLFILDLIKKNTVHILQAHMLSFTMWQSSLNS